MAFLATFLEYLVIFVILAGLAVAGFMVGKKLRTNKDAKLAAEANGDVAQNDK